MFCLKLKPQLWWKDLKLESLVSLSILCGSYGTLIEGTLLLLDLVSASFGSHCILFLFVSVDRPPNLVRLYFWFFGKLPLGYWNCSVHMNREQEVPECLCPLKQPLLDGEYKTPAPLSLLRTFWGVIYTLRISFRNKLNLLIQFLSLSYPAFSNSLIVFPGDNSLISHLYVIVCHWICFWGTQLLNTL